ncbi:hypothetical protein COOONC_07168 [Cooperia oncophora]
MQVVKGKIKLLPITIVDVERIHTDHVQDISAAQTIVKMIDYYSQLDLQHTAIGVDGSAYERQMDREDDGFIRIVDPYFKQDVGTLRCNDQYIFERNNESPGIDITFA